MVISKANVWLIISSIGLILSILFLVSTKVNKRGVFQAKHGDRQFRKDTLIGASWIALFFSIIGFAISYVYWYLIFIGIPVSILIMYMRKPHETTAHLRAIKKAVLKAIKITLGKIKSLLKGTAYKG